MLINTPPITINEWIALIQQDPEYSNQRLIWLREQIRTQGIMADPSLEISVENYENAQILLIKAAEEPQQKEKIARIAAVGQITLGGYPGRDGWLALIQSDDTLARLVYLGLEAKKAALGLQTPQELKTSMEIYQSIIAEHLL